MKSDLGKMLAALVAAGTSGMSTPALGNLIGVGLSATFERLCLLRIDGLVATVKDGRHGRVWIATEHRQARAEMIALKDAERRKACNQGRRRVGKKRDEAHRRAVERKAGERESQRVVKASSCPRVETTAVCSVFALGAA